jgi:ATP-binding cassette subfamily B protein
MPAHDELSLPLLWRCYRYLRPYIRPSLGAYALVLAITGLNVLIPQFIRWIVDQGIAQGNIPLLIRAVFGLLALSLLKGGFTYFQGKWSEVASQGVAYDIRNELERKLTRLSFTYHDQSEAGQLLSRSLQDVERIRFLTGRATLRIVDAVLLFVATSVVLVWMNARLAGLVVLMLPIIGWVGYRLGRQYRPLSAHIQDQLGVLTARLEQNLRGAQVVKAFAQEDAEVRRFAEQNESWFAMSALAARLQAINVPLMDLLANIGVVVVIWYGGLLVIDGQLTLGDLVAFSAYLGQLATPIRHLGLLIPAVAMASSAAGRVFAVLDSEIEVLDAPDAVELPAVAGDVQFQRVNFGYDNGRPVLQDINFTARAGQVIALLGTTGSGKSSIINLLPRFYEPLSGRILIDGFDIGAVTLYSLRRQIGIVLQESVLFATSVRENIAFGKPDASDEEIVAVARAAQAHDFIMQQLPNGYETHVGEKGSTLSGGQRQRIAIARALLNNPRILLLDDATASVDADTESLIQRALATLMEGRTTFIIAHRLSTIRRADLILMLERGRIVAQGTHEELLQRSAAYQAVYSRQVERAVA